MIDTFQDDIKNILFSLEEQLRFLNLEIDNPIEAAETSISIILKSIQKLKSLVIKHRFKNQFEEIYFFKKIKPQFLSKLIYYNRIYTIETHKPHGGEKVLRKHLNNELNKLKAFFDTNLGFYKYYRTDSDYLDHKYFVRGSHDIKLSVDSFFFETDHRFSTSHDYKVAKIISNDQVQVYLETELAALERKELKADVQEKSQGMQKPIIFWTASKASLIELLYALHASGSFNSGTAELKLVAHFIENSFGVELGQYNRTFLELRARKSGRTKYIDTLKDSLVKRMDDADDLL